MNRQISLLVFLVIHFTTASVLLAQNQLFGTLYNQSNELVYPANVLLLDSSTQKIIKFALASPSGTYQIKLESKIIGAYIEVRSLGYETETIGLKEQVYQYDFKLKESTSTLDSVLVKAAAIEEKGDTLSYRVGAFSNAQDQNIGQVLARMPGIEVSPSGQVFYQGKAINRYYVDNLDLLEGKYGLINQNLSAEDVATVEVLQNHQPLKILDSLVFSETAAINLKLKRKVTLSGPVEIAAGFRSDELLWKVKATPMLFNKNRQALLSYQINNTGEKVQNQLESFQLDDLIAGRVAQNYDQEFLSLRNPTLPSFETSKWLDNQVNLASANFLQKYTNDRQIKINLQLLNDKQLKESNIGTQFFVNNDTIPLNEQINNLSTKRNYLAKFIFEQNQQNKFIRNSTNISFSDDQADGRLSILGNQSIDQQLSQPQFRINNNFSSVHRYGKKNHIFNTRSYISVKYRNEILNVTPSVFNQIINPGIPSNQSLQSIDKLSFLANHAVNSIWKYQKWTINTSLGYRHEQSNLESQLQNLTESQGPSFRNKQDWLTSKWYVEPKIERKLKKGQLILTLASAWQRVRVNDIEEDTSYTQLAFVPEPRIFLLSKLAKHWNQINSVSYALQLAEIGERYNNFILKDYRTLQLRGVPLKRDHSFSALSGFLYQRPQNGVFAKFDIFYDHILKNLRIGNEILPAGNSNFFVQEENNIVQNLGLSASLQRRFFSSKSSLKLDLKANRQALEQNINGEINPIRNRQIEFRSILETAHVKLLNLSYSAQIEGQWTKVEAREIGLSIEQSHKLEISYLPDDIHAFTLTNEWVENTRPNSKANAFFVDFKYRYSPLEKKWSINFRAENLLNQEYYQRFINSNFSAIAQDFRLRGRQLLAGIQYSF